jgi:hypothetical protein
MLARDPPLQEQGAATIRDKDKGMIQTAHSGSTLRAHAEYRGSRRTMAMEVKHTVFYSTMAAQLAFGLLGI